MKIYTDLEDALKDPDIDLFDVQTPHRFHEDHVVRIAEAGKHISCQKVPTLTLSSFDRMTQVARKNDVKFRIFENFRFHPPYLRAMDLVDRGVIGKVHNVNFRMWGSENPLTGWEVPLMTWKWRIADNQNYRAPTLFDDGYHKHSVVAWFLGDEPITKVRTWSNHQHVQSVIPWDTPAVVIYETGKRYRYAQWNVSIAKNLPVHSDYYGGDEFLEIQGENGIIFVNGCTGNMFKYSQPTGPGIPGVYWMDETGTWQADTTMNTNWKYSFINCTRHFINAIKTDTDPILTPKEARYILQINLAVVKSMRNYAAPVSVHSISDGL